MVAEYLAKAGLVAKLPDDVHEMYLTERFGDAAIEYQRGDGPDRRADSHGRMSANLELGLAIRSQIWGDRIEAFLSWFAAANLPQPERIVDLGCDIGIQACFYAIRFPDSQVVGIDRCAKSIQCAKQLAAKLSVKNVEFVQADMNELPDEVRSQKFDMVVSCFVANYLADQALGPTRSVEEVEGQTCDPGLTKYATLISALLRDTNGVYLSFERMFRPIDLAGWIWALQYAGIPIRSNRIDMLEFRDERHEPMRAPILLGPRQVASVLTSNDLRGLWLKDVCRGENDEQYRLAAGEQSFVSTCPKELVAGFCCARLGNWPFHVEIWTAETGVLV
jgi:SAM-dependent methyltransferase